MSPRALLVLAALLAGCAAPAASPEDHVRPAAVEPLRGPAFAAAVETGMECRFSCYEPAVAVDPQGRIFAADGGAKEIAVSEDGGATWTTMPAPPVPPPLPARPGDVLLQVAPSGRLYWSALLVRTTPVGGFLLEGIQVAWSDDGARTWAGNVQLSPLAGPTTPVYAADRQWLGFGEGEEVVLTYNQIPTGIWFARSTDGGASWTGWTRAAPLEGRGAGIGQSGPPVVDAEGRIAVPACVMATRTTFGVFVSEDAGRTFRRHDVAGATGCSWFPVLAAAPDGGLVAAWHDGSGRIFVSGSDDGGASWSEPRRWAQASPTSPWPIALGEGRLALAWFETEKGETSLLVARGTIEARGTATVLAEGLAGPNTDFAHVVARPDGRLVTTWSTAEAKDLLVAVEE